jgi:hypothetical protein
MPDTPCELDQALMACVCRPANMVVRLGTHCGAAAYLSVRSCVFVSLCVCLVHAADRSDSIALDRIARLQLKIAVGDIVFVGE